MKVRPLKYRIAIVIFILQTLLIGGIFALTLALSWQSSEKQLEIKKKTLLSIIDEISRVALIQGEYDDLQIYISNLANDEQIELIRVYDTFGQIIVGTNRADVGKRVALSENLSDRLATFQTISNQSGRLGGFYLKLSDVSLMRDYREIRNIGLIFALLAIIVSAFLGLAVGRILTERLKNLEAAVQHVIDGNYEILDVLPGNDEVSRLSQSFNQMNRSLLLRSRERDRAEEQLKASEERLHRSEKMEALGQLAGGVAHDLNNVLGVLSGYSELLLEKIPEGQSARSYVEKILQSTERGAAIIQDLLTLARRGVIAADVINLNSVVSDFLKTPVFEKLKDYHPRVTFITECDQNLLNIKGSLVHLEKTLMNLVSNAAESISGEGEVTIRTESRYLDKTLRGYDEVKEGDYAVLTVSDTGMGIPAENREKIFEPFYTKKAMGRSGTGLGLAIVWGTVKDLNGYIDVQSEVGEGTTFTLYFPVTREEVITAEQRVPIEQYMSKGESVLVVDDIAEQRDVATGLLTRLGYKVHEVSSGEEAVEYLKANKTDILLLDMIMAPGIDGLETYQRVMEINPRQKAILVSGFSETDRVREAQRLGAGAYVKKPYIMEKIGIVIRDELNR